MRHYQNDKAMPDIIRLLAYYDFVPIYGADSKVREFQAVDHYRRCIAAGLVKPGGKWGGGVIAQRPVKTQRQRRRRR